MSKSQNSSPGGEAIALTRPLRVSDLSRKPKTLFDLAPNGTVLDAVAAHLGAQAVQKFKFTGEITTLGDHELLLNGKLGATLNLTCVVSLKTFNHRVDIDVRRKFVESDPSESVSGEIELAEDFDEEVEPLRSHIDPGEIAIEELALALPAFPRAPDANLEQAQFTAPGAVPLSDAASKPFAALAALKDKSQDEA